MIPLFERKCRACASGEEALSREKADALLKETRGWEIVDEHHLNKRFRFENFQSALDFVNAVGVIAEAENHHPDLILKWGSVEVTIFTHTVGGLSENDFILAAKIDRIFPDAQERGVALLMAIFIITIATLLVMELGKSARFDSRFSRSFAEGVQAEYMMRSAVNFGRLLIELPKQPQFPQDWLREPWSVISQQSKLPISGVAGEIRMEVVDESAKLDVNILGEAGSRGASSSGTPKPSSADRWKERFATLFNSVGLSQENYDPKSRRTLGNVGFEPLQQVAVIADWIDRDQTSFQSAGFPASGIESQADKKWFYNRKLIHLTELLLVPGITRERFQRLLPFLRVSSDEAEPEDKRVNVNTAPYEVLVSIGYPESTALEIVQSRMNTPIDQNRLAELNRADPDLGSVTSMTSQQFSVVVRAKLPNTTRWARAIISVDGTSPPPAPRSTTLNRFEIY